MSKKKEDVTDPQRKADIKTGWKWFWIIIGILFLSNYIYGPASNENPTVKYANVNGQEQEITHRDRVFDFGSSQQQYFRSLVNKTKASIPEGSTSAREKKIWIEASAELCKSNVFDAFGIKEGWVGYVDSSFMRDNGKIAIEIVIGETDNEVRDPSVDKKLEDVVIDLKSGDIVNFSGYFLRGDKDENECLKAGLDSNPELYYETFRFRLTKIEKVTTRTVQKVE